jgi:hypothetical protein
VFLLRLTAVVFTAGKKGRGLRKAARLGFLRYNFILIEADGPYLPENFTAEKTVVKVLPSSSKNRFVFCSLNNT